MKKLLFAALPALLLWGCYPAGPEYYEDLDVVATRFDRDFNFAGTNKKYAMPDDIVKLDGSVVGDDGPEFLPPSVAGAILSRIETNMTSYGWQRVDNVDEADVVILPAVWTNTTVYYWYDYWCYWYYYYCGGWGWGYPAVSSYTTGTLLMTMAYNQEVGADPLPYRVWTGAINGLLSGAYDVSRVNNGVDQAFKQSTYLKVN